MQIFPITADHDALLNFVADEHIDWTDTTEDLETTGSGTFGGGLYTDTITEETDDAGVTIEGSLLKDNVISTDELTIALGANQDYLFTNRDNSLALQGQAAGTTSSMEIYSKDGNSSDDVRMSIFGKGTPTDIDPYEVLHIFWDATDSYYRIRADKGGVGGVTRPLSLGTFGHEPQIVLATNGNVGIGGLPGAYGLDVG